MIFESFEYIASKPAFSVPPQACDCHVHVFGPATEYPFSSKRTYTPMDAVPAEALQMMAILGLERLVLVQPSVYGTDNRCLLNALSVFGNRARGVAVLDESISEKELKQMRDVGVRGIRLNIDTGEEASFEKVVSDIEHLADKIGIYNWHIQLFVNQDILEKLVPVVEKLPVDVVFDHMGKIKADNQKIPQGLEALQYLLKKEKCWVKLSGAYRLDDQLGCSEAVNGLAKSLVEANPQRIVWGSDWPHTPVHGKTPVENDRPVFFRKIDTGHLLDLLAAWVPEKDLQARILVENPACLYDFN